MEKDHPTTDYASILVDMEGKKAALEAAITSLRAALAIGALGVAGDIPTGSTATGASGGAVTLPRGAFLGKTATDAIKLFLSAVRKKQTNKEIAQALRDGGLESTGNFDNYVTHGLFRLKNEGTVLRFDDGWGLAEWYPESFRTRVVEKSGNDGKRKTTKKAARKTKASDVKVPQAPVEGIEKRIETMLRSEPSRVFRVPEIANILGVNTGATGLTLGRMAGKHKAEKCEGGGYRAFSGNVQEIPKAAKVS